MYSRFYRTGVLLINILILAFSPLIYMPAQHTGSFNESENVQDLRFEDPFQEIVTINFQMANNLIIVPVQINNSDTLWFILDTGTSQSVIADLPGSASINLKDTREIELRVPGSSSPHLALYTTGNKTSLSGLTGSNLDYYVLIDDNLNLSRKIGFPVHGILSYSVFKSFVVEIDYESQIINVYRSGQYPYSKLDEKNHSVPLSVIDGKPHITARLEPARGVSIAAILLIDTGLSNSIWLNKKDLPEELAPSEDIRTYLGCGLAGEVYGSITRMRNIRLDQHTFNQTIVCYPDSSNLQYNKGSSGNMGSLGAEILKRFTVLIDYPDSMITFIKNSAFSEKFNMNMTGIELFTSGSDYRSYAIHQIRQGSPADKAGLKISDELISIDNIPVTNYTLSNIYSLFKQKAGRILSLTINRKGETLTVDIQLEPFI